MGSLLLGSGTSQGFLEIPIDSKKGNYRKLKELLGIWLVWECTSWYWVGGPDIPLEGLGGT